MTSAAETAGKPVTELISSRTVVNCGIVVVSLVAMLAACTAPSRLPAGSDSISVAVRFVNSAGDPILADDRPVDASLLLGAIAGEIAGSQNRTLQTVRIAELPTIEINLRSLSSAIGQQAATLTSSGVAAGLQVTPADTKFTRVSTFLKWRKWRGRHSLQIGFADPDDDSSTLTLVYFDRPCRLTGTVERLYRGEKETFVYDVTIEKAGLSWLITIPKGSTESVVRVAPALMRPILLIQVGTE